MRGGRPEAPRPQLASEPLPRRGPLTPAERTDTPLSLCVKSPGGDDKRLHGNRTKLVTLGGKTPTKR